MSKANNSNHANLRLFHVLTSVWENDREHIEIDVRVDRGEPRFNIRSWSRRKKRHEFQRSDEEGVNLNRKQLKWLKKTIDKAKRLLAEMST